jgi:hypothetical protein
MFCLHVQTIFVVSTLRRSKFSMPLSVVFRRWSFVLYSELSCSNPDQDTCYPDWGVQWHSSVPACIEITTRRSIICQITEADEEAVSYKTRINLLSVDIYWHLSPGKYWHLFTPIDTNHPANIDTYLHLLTQITQQILTPIYTYWHKSSSKYWHLFTPIGTNHPANIDTYWHKSPSKYWHLLAQITQQILTPIDTNHPANIDTYLHLLTQISQQIMTPIYTYWHKSPS